MQSCAVNQLVKIKEPKGQKLDQRFTCPSHIGGFLYLRGGVKKLKNTKAKKDYLKVTQKAEPREQMAQETGEEKSGQERQSMAVTDH